MAYITHNAMYIILILIIKSYCTFSKQSQNFAKHTNINIILQISNIIDMLLN